MNRDLLKELIVRSLRKQGFRVQNSQILPPADLTKERMRALHSIAVQHKVDTARVRLEPYEPALLQFIARGRDINPELISPKLVEVHADTIEERLFRHTCLHWSIPVSSGYGRRLRFLVIDTSNEKLMGVIGLGDPVFSLGARDSWIGWSYQQRRERLQNCMDAFVLGAVPPYSQLLCGKLVAMLATSNQVRDAFKRKYGHGKSLIRRTNLDGRLALVTTTSALGRSSLYNRLRFGDRLVYEGIGFTKGSGDFHFSNGLYGAISDYAGRYCIPTAKKRRWGNGFRNRREVIKKCLSKIGLSTEMIYHGIQREIFAAPLASNTREFLRGERSRLSWYGQTEESLFSYFRDRWLLPRSRTDARYLEWQPEMWRLWTRESKLAEQQMKRGKHRGR